MTPILQRLVALAVGILLRFLLLCQMSLTVRDHLPHVLKILVVVLIWLFTGILVEDIDDLAATVIKCQ